MIMKMKTWRVVWILNYIPITWIGDRICQWAPRNKTFFLIVKVAWRFIHTRFKTWLPDNFYELISLFIKRGNQWSYIIIQIFILLCFVGIFLNILIKIIVKIKFVDLIIKLPHYFLFSCMLHTVASVFPFLSFVSHCSLLSYLNYYQNVDCWYFSKNSL